MSNNTEKQEKRLLTDQSKQNDLRVYISLNTFKDLSLVIGEPVHIVNDEDHSIVLFIILL